MEKPLKLPFSTQPPLSARTNFNTPQNSTLCSSRQKLPPHQPYRPKKLLHSRFDSSNNLTQNDFFKVRPQPLRSTQQKFIRHSDLVDPNCHKDRNPRPNYFQQGKISHRQVDWILHNITNYMVTLWVKNQRTLHALTKHFYPNHDLNLDASLQDSNLSFLTNPKTMPTAPSKSQNSSPQILPLAHLPKLPKTLNLRGTQFSSILDADPIKEEEEVKQIVDLMFPFKQKNLPKGQFNFDTFNGSKNIKKDNPQNPKNIYKFLVEQQHSEPTETLKKITARNQQLLPILMDFSRKILVKKQNLLIQKLLKNEKLDDFILDSLSFDDKVKMYENILVKRMDDFKLLKDSYIKMTANTEQQMKNNKELISQFISRSKVKCSTSKNVLIKSIRFDQILSLFKAKVVEPPPQNHQYLQDPPTPSKSKLPPAKLSGFSSNRSQTKKYSTRQLHFGVSSVNIQFGQKTITSGQISVKPEKEPKKPVPKRQRLSFLNFDEIIQHNESQLKKQKRPYLKSIKSIRHFKQPEQQEVPNLRSLFETKKFLEPQKAVRANNVKKQTRHVKHKNSIASSLKSQQRKLSQKHQQIQLDEEKQTPAKTHKNHETSPFKLTDKNFLKQMPSKKKFELAEQKRAYFLKNKRKGVKFSPFTTKQFLKYLHDRNLSKFSELSSEFKNDQTDIDAKEKSKFYTADNSPFKGRDQFSPTQKMIKGNWRKGRKDSDRNIRRQMEKRKSNKGKEQNPSAFSPSASESESKTVSRLKRLRHEGQNMLHHKILEKILRQKVIMDRQKNSYVVRDKMTGYFNRLLESGMFEQEGLAEHKENVENLIRNYDQRRRNANMCKTLLISGQKSDGDKSVDEFNINVKLRHDDPQIFDRLKDIHTGLRSNPEPSMFTKPVVNKNDQLEEELNEFKKNQEAHRRNSHAEFDLQFSDFFSPIRTRYDEDQIQEQKDLRESNDDEAEMLEFMKRLIKKSYLLLGQKDI